MCWFRLEFVLWTADATARAVCWQVRAPLATMVSGLALLSRVLVERSHACSTAPVSTLRVVRRLGAMCYGTEYYYATRVVHGCTSTYCKKDTCHIVSGIRGSAHTRSHLQLCSFGFFVFALRSQISVRACKK